MKVTIALSITGKVQGVNYRYYCREKAISLGITGSVGNLPDGTVYLLATGEAEALENLYHWCLVGPPGAKVENVNRTVLPLQAFSEFRIKR